jgi:hypothetical protein
MPWEMEDREPYADEKIGMIKMAFYHNDRLRMDEEIADQKARAAKNK